MPNLYLSNLWSFAQLSGVLQRSQLEESCCTYSTHARLSTRPATDRRWTGPYAARGGGATPCGDDSGLRKSSGSQIQGRRARNDGFRATSWRSTAACRRQCAIRQRWRGRDRDRDRDHPSTGICSSFWGVRGAGPGGSGANVRSSSGPVVRYASGTGAPASSSPLLSRSALLGFTACVPLGCNGVHS